MDKVQKLICDFDFALSDAEWEEVRGLARQIFASGQFGKDHCKSYVAAFIIYSEIIEEHMLSEVDQTNVH